MSELISAAILIGLALWGFGCHFARKSRRRRVAAPALVRKGRLKVRVPLIFLVFAAAAPLRSSQAQASPAPLDAVQQQK